MHMQVVPWTRRYLRTLEGLSFHPVGKTAMLAGSTCMVIFLFCPGGQGHCMHLGRCQVLDSMRVLSACMHVCLRDTHAWANAAAASSGVCGSTSSVRQAVLTPRTALCIHGSHAYTGMHGEDTGANIARVGHPFTARHSWAPCSAGYTDPIQP
jgi:hypothetical protein